MAKSVRDVAKYTKIHIKYNVLISGKTAISRSPLVLLVTDTLTFIIYIYYKCQSLISEDQ
jgi:hypothetical protein